MNAGLQPPEKGMVLSKTDLAELFSRLSQGKILNAKHVAHLHATFSDKDDRLADLEGKVARLIKESSRFIDLAPGMHYANLTIRSNGADRVFEADYLVRALEALLPNFKT